MHQASPGVERAGEAARQRAERRGMPVHLADLLLGLLDEEEGRPAVLVERAGLVVAGLRDALTNLTPAAVPDAPPIPDLFSRARQWSIVHRADPAFMTDAVLLVVLRADPAFRRLVAPLGLDPDRLEALLIGEREPAAAHAPPAEFLLPDPAADATAARILDANFNRAREALRVLEDYCRFGLDDRFLTEEVKTLRHDLAAVSALFPPQLLLSARDTPGDVGTAVSAGGEYERASPADVAAVNLKRLQESLRSLEEFGKLSGQRAGRELEAIRYRAYSLERAVVRGAGARDKLARARLYVLLTGAQCAASMEWVIEQAAADGADVFQLREKELPDAELLARARDVRRWTRKAGALFVVNDRPDIARLAEADGVHLGQDDLPVRDARRILGPDALIGVSTHSLEQLRRAVLDGADYIGVGPTFPSRTKAFDHFPGLEFVRAAAAETSLPAFALGGIGPENVAAVVAAGARRIAVASAITGAEEPGSVARVLRAALPE